MSFRPRYETPADRQKEARTFRALSLIFGADILPTEPLTPWDGELFRCGRLIGLIEIKHRECFLGEHPTLKISRTKIEKCVARAAAIQTGFWLAVVLQDAIAVRRIGPIDLQTWQTERWGRRDRGDAQDIEDALVVPLSEFHFSRLSSL